MATIYKIIGDGEWQAFRRSGTFAGSPVDTADGYIHFSTAAQVRRTAAKHFAGRDGLLLLAVDTAALGDALRHEPARGGDLFPHLYGPLGIDAVRWARPLPLGPDGGHVFPELDA